jgi:bis(5'-nucleosyl)-tetraphosphatase (symmetrical)
MRFCTQDVRMEFQAEGATPPAGFLPWYETRSTSEPPIVFGHWSDLGLRLDHRASCLDSGCVWGGFLSALRLEDRALVQVPCSGYLIKARGGQ